MTTLTQHRPRRRASRLPAWSARVLAAHPALVVGCIVAGSALALGIYTTRVTEWLVMTDEMQYVKLGLGITHGDLLPTLRGERYYAYNQLYPALIAPLLAVLDMPSAFRAIHVLNGLLFASAAIPAFLLGRGLGLGRVPSYLLAALTVAVPWTALSIMVMTENAAYPAFVWALLAMQRAIAEPSPRRDLLAFAAIALAALARTQFLLLAGIFPAAVVAHQIAYRLAARRRGDGPEAPPPLRAALRGHAVLIAGGAAGALLLAVLLAAGKLSVLVGSYAATIDEGSLLPPGSLHAAQVHLALITVGLGVVPVALGTAWALTTLVRPLSRSQHALATLAIVLVPILALQVASFNLRFASGATQTRYLFYVAPLFLAGAVAVLCNGRRYWLPAVAASVAVFMLVGLGSYLDVTGPFFSAPETAFYKFLDGRSYLLGQNVGRAWRGSDVVPVAGLLACLLTCGLLRVARAPVALALVGLGLLAGLGYETRYVLIQMVHTPNGARVVSGTSTDGRDWVDRATPGEPQVASLPLPLNAFGGRPEDRGYFQQQLWWDVEFWNKTVDRTYTYAENERFTVFHTLPLRVDAATGRVAAADQRPYLVTSGSFLGFGLAGDELARDPTGSAVLLRARRPYRAAWTAGGLAGEGWTGAGPARLRLYPDGGRPTRHAVRIELAAPAEATAPVRYRLSVPGAGVQSGRLGPGERRWAALTACVRAPVEAVLRVPARTELPDGRRVGLQVRQVRDELGGC